MTCRTFCRSNIYSICVGREGVSLVWIQGSRNSASSPWLADDGTPLPYTGTIDNESYPGAFKMAFYQRLYAYPPSGQYYPLCEI